MISDERLEKVKQYADEIGGGSKPADWVDTLEHPWTDQETAMAVHSLLAELQRYRKGEIVAGIEIGATLYADGSLPVEVSEGLLRFSYHSTSDLYDLDTVIHDMDMGYYTSKPI